MAEKQLFRHEDTHRGIYLQVVRTGGYVWIVGDTMYATRGTVLNDEENHALAEIIRNGKDSQ